MEWYDNTCYWYGEDKDMNATIPYCAKCDSYARGEYCKRQKIVMTKIVNYIFQKQMLKI